MAAVRSTSAVLLVAGRVAAPTVARIRRAPAVSVARIFHSSVEALAVLTQEAKLSQRIGVPSDAFARSIALDQDELFVGAAGEPDAFPGQGAVWAWWQNFGYWEERQRITAPDAAANDAFGSAVAIEGNVAFIGASGDDEGAASERGSRETSGCKAPKMPPFSALAAKFASVASDESIRSAVSCTAGTPLLRDAAGEIISKVSQHVMATQAWDVIPTMPAKAASATTVERACG